MSALLAYLAATSAPPAAPLPEPADMPGPRSPRATGWRRCASPQPRHFAWRKVPLFVISSVSVMDLPDGAGQGPTWLVSVTRGGERATDREVRRILRDFGMLSAEEDNHNPGKARAFFLVVDPAHRVDCECKATETVHVEPDGYTWSEKNGTCGGCELERITGQPCRVHAEGR